MVRESEVSKAYERCKPGRAALVAAGGRCMEVTEDPAGIVWERWVLPSGISAILYATSLWWDVFRPVTGSNRVDSTVDAIQRLARAKSHANPNGCIKPDTDTQIYFYEQDFYVLSNFSAFTLVMDGVRYDTSEAAYHVHKFPDRQDIREAILHAPSAHEAYKVAERHKADRRPDWDAVKVDVMRQILWAKVEQYEYVRRKLLDTGERELVEDSWRDDFWGWGPNRDGRNMLGKLWMEVREQLRQKMMPAPAVQDG